MSNKDRWSWWRFFNALLDLGEPLQKAPVEVQETRKPDPERRIHFSRPEPRWDRGTERIREVRWGEVLIAHYADDTRHHPSWCAEILPTEQGQVLGIVRVFGVSVPEAIDYLGTLLKQTPDQKLTAFNEARFKELFLRRLA